MNIFATDKCPVKSAQNLCDIHINKMLIESVQLLCTYLNERGYKTPYKSTHKNHPCQKWLTENVCNLGWLRLHTDALAKEYTHRYGKIHKSELAFNSIFEYLHRIAPHFSYPNNFKQCMPDEYKCNSSIEAYRKYYISKQYTMKIPMRWTNRDVPTWFIIE